MSEIDVNRVPDYQREIRFDGKVFVVFGAGDGMGRQSAHALAQMGAKVVCVGRRAEATERVAREVAGVAVLGDMSRRDNAQRAFDEIDKVCGRLDGVVDIIGINRVVPFMDLREDDWDAQFRQGFLHAVHALQMGGPTIARYGGGSITLVGSVAGMAATTGAVPYGAFKAALHHLTQAAGVQFGPSGVRVNCVVPGLTVTPRLLDVLGEERFHEIAKDYPLGRVPEASDVARAILFLASDLSRNITSQLLIVDGGASARAAPPLTPDYGLR